MMIGMQKCAVGSLPKKKHLGFFNRMLLNRYKKIINMLEDSMRSEKADDNIAIDHIEYDEDVSKKFFDFIINLMKLEDNLSISFDMSRIEIIAFINMKPNSPSSNIQNPESRIEIFIGNGIFSIHKDYGFRAMYKDENMYDKLLPLVMSKKKVMNKLMFFDIINEFIFNSPLMRQINLDELIGEEE